LARKPWDFFTAFDRAMKDFLKSSRNPFAHVPYFLVWSPHLGWSADSPTRFWPQVPFLSFLIVLQSPKYTLRPRQDSVAGEIFFTYDNADPRVYLSESLPLPTNSGFFLQILSTPADGSGRLRSGFYHRRCSSSLFAPPQLHAHPRSKGALPGFCPLR